MEKLLPAMLDVLGFVLLLCSTIQEGQGKGNINPTLELLPSMSTHILEIGCLNPKLYREAIKRSKYN